ncbi:carboxymuconolactone decarboxylase family protein [Carnobacterium maltaromaticum]|uniref:carboxymuconolactone decarboxylase family protein n=1 Tax=Carnobacterium maltaromaticum TaxID=2751 RepID=UPI00191BA00A|nr:carboxymuconolactone decarboxylase family protein [Carnobacterium maltaromaticum]CAD5901051.1 Carboxymuconolactone decarboxylase [Carnobacterium maltaromaticum]
MAISKTAQKNHDELFPNHQSVLAETDPEFIELFDNFTFDEVLQYSTIDVKLRMKLTLASLIAMQSVNEYKAMMVGALNVGVSPAEIKEIVYQAVPYAGLGKVFDFLHATNEVLLARGIKLPLEKKGTTTVENRYQKGLEVVRQVADDAVDKMLETMPSNQKHLATFLADNCFGDYFTREGLTAQERELLIFTMLASMGGADMQLKGHIRNNDRIGNKKERLIETITILLPFIGYPRTLTALTCINEILPEKNKPSEMENVK